MLSTKRFKVSVAAGAVALLGAPLVYAQGADVGAAVQQQQRFEQQTQELQRRVQGQQEERTQQVREQVQVLGAPVQGAYAKLPKDEQPCFVLHSVRFAGVEGAQVPRALLAGLDSVVQFSREASNPHPIYDTPLNQCVGAQGLQVLVQRAQNHLIERGFITSRVLVGEQDLSQGALVLTVVPGYVAQIKGKESKATARMHTALPTGAGQMLNLRDIEQGLENLKRVPTADADVQIMPVSEVGQSDVVVSYVQTRPVRFGVSLDNYGSDSTGKWQGGVTASVDNPLRLNDLFYASYTHALGGGERSAAGGRGSWGYALGWT